MSLPKFFLSKDSRL